MTVDPGRHGRLEQIRRVVELVGEILTVAVVARSLLGDRRPAAAERPSRDHDTRRAATSTSPGRLDRTGRC